ncbi:MAG TPA: PIN domain-containing protein [Verrucomicrobiae bacterium]|jgi:predicted nucleic acid-binding protein|nr:PIN domain-containing protein [Verrucomicrobiae bacterium]
MTAPVFVDTNVLLYAFDRAAPEKQRAARAWRDALWKSRLGRISFQVLQEFYANVAAKWPDGREDARTEIRDLLAWRPAVVNIAVLELAWKLQEHYSLSFWDALIGAAAKLLDCGYLLTEDLQTGQNLDGVRVINPFRTAPADISLE